MIDTEKLSVVTQSFFSVEIWLFAIVTHEFGRRHLLLPQKEHHCVQFSIQKQRHSSWWWAVAEYSRCQFERCLKWTTLIVRRSWERTGNDVLPELQEELGQKSFYSAYISNLQAHLSGETREVAALKRHRVLDWSHYHIRLGFPE